MKLEITKEEKEGLNNTFKNFNKRKTKEQTFYDLCFCICSPQTTFKNNIRVIAELKKKDFYTKDITNLQQILKPTRFYNNKTKYILEAKNKFEDIIGILWELRGNYHHMNIFEKAKFKRRWLVKYIKGLGMKTASHFLRNNGDKELAIIDTHIIKFLTSYDLPKNKRKDYSKIIQTKNGYELTEIAFKNIALINKLTTAELDLLIWIRYSKTPWNVIKY